MSSPEFDALSNSRVWYYMKLMVSASFQCFTGFQTRDEIGVSWLHDHLMNNNSLWTLRYILPVPCINNIISSPSDIAKNSPVKKKQATGPDEALPQILKTAGQPLAGPLLNLCTILWVPRMSMFLASGRSQELIHILRRRTRL